MNRVQGGLLKFHELCHFFKKIGQEIPRKEQEIPRKWQEITGRPFWGRCK
jgi:hypothetical protein